MSLPPRPTVLGSLEQQVMDVLWNKSPQDVTGVQAALQSESAYSTVKTVMERLTVKELLIRNKVGKAFEYRPALSRTDFQARQVRGLSQSLLSGFGTKALTHFVDAVREHPDQLEELRRLLTELEEQ